MGINGTGQTSRQSPGRRHVRPIQVGQSKNIDNTKDVQRLMKLALEKGTARAERIAKIRQAIAAGTYDVSDRAVADALIRHVLTDGLV